jgi:hypothetical protein
MGDRAQVGDRLLTARGVGHRVVFAARVRVALAGLAALLAGLAPGTAAALCDPHGCGSNTAAVNKHRVGAFNLDGRINAEGFSIAGELYPADLMPSSKFDPRSLPQAKYRLDIGSAQTPNPTVGELVGVELPSGGARLRGKDLEGWWFVLRQHDLATRKVVTQWPVAISRVALVELFPRPGLKTPREFVMAYEFTLPTMKPLSGSLRCATPETEGTPGTEGADCPFLCPNPVKWGEDPYSAAPTVPGADPPYPPGFLHQDVLPWTKEGRFAVLVGGETYNHDEATVQFEGKAAARWFNVACSGTAYSKMKLMGYDPQRANPKTTARQRQATLKMITARYCSGTKDLVFTREGQRLVWENGTRWFQPDAARVGKYVVEAAWDASGATCLSTPRRVGAKEDPAWTASGVRSVCGERRPAPRGGLSSPKNVGTSASPPASVHLRSPKLRGGARLPECRWTDLAQAPAGVEWVTATPSR